MEASPLCPRCREHFQKGRLLEVKVHICSRCEGLLVKQGVLLTLLERLIENIDFQDHRNQKFSDSGEFHNVERCPLCESKMESFGYMGDNSTTISQCVMCYETWIENRKLFDMASMLYQSKRIIEKNNSDLEKFKLQAVKQNSVNFFIAGFLLGMVVGGE